MRIVSVNVARPRTVTWRRRPVTTAISCVKLEKRESFSGAQGLGRMESHQPLLASGPRCI
jgi:hypothetical protein